MKLRRTIVAATAATVLLASTVMSGYALDTATSSITIGGGNFSAAITASNFANLPYSLTDQTARNGSLILTVNDQTGDAGGWSVTVDISNFIGQDRPDDRPDIQIDGHASDRHWTVIVATYRLSYTEEARPAVPLLPNGQKDADR